MTIKRVIVNLGTVYSEGDYQKFSFRSPYPNARLVGVSVFSHEAHASTINKKAAIELAMTCDDGDINLFNDMIGLKRKHLDENASMVRELDQVVGKGKISGYVKCVKNTTTVALTLKLYLKFEDK